MSQSELRNRTAGQDVSERRELQNVDCLNLAALFYHFTMPLEPCPRPRDTSKDQGNLHSRSDGSNICGIAGKSFCFSRRATMFARRSIVGFAPILGTEALHSNNSSTLHDHPIVSGGHFLHVLVVILRPFQSTE
jgi:hypothetical protein